MSPATNSEYWSELRKEFPEAVAEFEAALDQYMVGYEKELDQALAAAPPKPKADE